MASPAQISVFLQYSQLRLSNPPLCSTINGIRGPKLGLIAVPARLAWKRCEGPRAATNIRSRCSVWEVF